MASQPKQTLSALLCGRLESSTNVKRIHLNRIGIMRAIFGVLALCAAQAIATAAGASPRVGDPAPDFTLKTLDDQTVRLGELTANRKVTALVVLRGWPGYQCPICDRQVSEFIGSATAFAQAGVQLLFVYPGPAAELKAHAREFKSWKGREWPKDFLLALDPDYTMVNAYGLRWDAPKETAYPSTFLLDSKSVVRFSKVSTGHGDRSKAADVLAEAKKIPGK